MFRHILVLGMMLAGAVRAVPITWDVNGTSLGTTITGSFVFDPTSDIFSSIRIQTAGGSVIPSTTYTSLTEYGPFIGAPPTLFVGFVDTNAADQTGADMLGFFLTSYLTNAAGTIPWSGTQEGICLNSNCANLNLYPGQSAPDDFSASGSITGIVTPEPAGWTLMLCGLLVLGTIRRLRLT